MTEPPTDSRQRLPRAGTRRSRSRRRAKALAAVAGALVLLSVLAVLGPADGGNAHQSVPATFGVAATEYNITFSETGLPNGTSWTFVLAGTHHTNNSSTVVVPQGNGSYAWSVLWVSEPSANGSAGWAPLVPEGNLRVSGSAATVNISFVPGYDLLLTAVNLPPGTTWAASVDTLLFNGTDNPHLFLVPPGNYILNVSSPIAGPPGTRYVASFLSIPLLIQNANWSGNDTFTTQYYLTTSTNPLGGGTITPTSGWIDQSTSVPLNETPAQGGQFSGWTGSGPGNYTGPNATALVTMLGPISEVANFVGLEEISFEESGLPSGTSWSVTFSGNTSSSMGSSINFTAASGVTYNYTVGPVTGYVASPSSGSVNLTGSNLTVAIQWTRSPFSITFAANGLPTGTNWSVTLNGTVRSSTGTTIVFAERSGQYAFTVGKVVGFTATPAVGSVRVDNSSVFLTIGWTRTSFDYRVTFAESGLPPGTNWTVTLNGTARSGTSANLTFLVPNGTYPVSVMGPAGYRTSALPPQLTVAGAPVVVPVSWTAVTYALTFVESGLSAGTVWSVALDGTVQRSAGSTINFGATNGSHYFTIGNVTGYSVTPRSGLVTVLGATTNETIRFVQTSTGASSPLSLTGGEWTVVAGVVICLAAVTAGLAYGRRRRKRKTK